MSDLSSEAILVQLQAHYRAGCADFRDRMLVCGGLVHRYLLAYLEEGDRLSEVARLKAEITRSNGIRLAAAKLGIPETHVRRMLSAAMFVDLVGEPVVSLSYWSLIYLSRFARRKVGVGKSAGHRNETASCSERWELRERFAAKAVALFRTAEAENWGLVRVKAEFMAVLFGCADRRPRTNRAVVEKRQSIIDELHGSVKAAAPGDVAEICIELIERAENPADVAIRLRVLLQKYLPKKQTT